MRFGEELRPQVRRPDRVRVGDDRRPSIFVSTDSKGKAEREDQPDNTEERCLQDAERLSQRLVVLSQAATEQHTSGRHACDHRKDDHGELPAAQRKERQDGLEIVWDERKSPSGSEVVPLSTWGVDRMFTLEQINFSWERARQRSADGEVLRRRIAVIGAVAAGFCGLLLAIGLGFVVLVFLAGVVVSAGAVALLRLWPRLRAAGRNGVVSVRDRSRAAHRRLVPIAHTAARGARTAFLEARAHSHELARSTARSSQRAGGGLAQAGHAGASWFARRAARRRLVPIAHTAARGARTAFLEARAHSHELARSSQQAGGGLAQAGRAATLRFARRAALLDPQREAIRLNATGTQHRR